MCMQEIRSLDIGGYKCIWMGVYGEMKRYSLYFTTKLLEEMSIKGGLESGGKDNAKQTNGCLLRVL